MRIVLLMLGFIALAFAWRHEQPIVGPRLRVLYDQHRCEVWDCSEPRIAFSDDPVDVALIGASPDYLHCTRPTFVSSTQPEGAVQIVSSDFVYHVPRALVDFSVLTNVVFPAGFRIHFLTPLSSEGVVFLHARRSEEGTTRIVVVMTAGEGEIEAQLIAPGSYSQPPVDVTGLKGYIDSEKAGINDLRLPKTTRFFVGHPDQADDARFLVTFEVNGKRGQIEGCLINGTDIRFRLANVPPGIAPLAFEQQ